MIDRFVLLKQIDMKKIKLEVMKPYITERLNSYMTVEDEVLVEYVFSQLEADQVTARLETSLSLHLSIFFDSF